MFSTTASLRISFSFDSALCCSPFSFSFPSRLASTGSGVGGAFPIKSNCCAKILKLLNVAVKFVGGGPLGVGEGAPSSVNIFIITF